MAIISILNEHRLPDYKPHAFFVPYHTPYTPYTYLIYNIPVFRPLYTTCLLLLYICLPTTTSKLITIYNLHKTNIYSLHHFRVGQTKTYQNLHKSVGGSRVGKTYSFQGPRASSPPQAPTPLPSLEFSPFPTKQYHSSK